MAKLKGFLKDDDSAVRYWGAIGILNRGAAAVGSSVAELKAALKDTSVYVRVAAAYGLGKHGKGRELQRTGIDVLLSEAPWQGEQSVFGSMVALNALDKLDGKAAYAKDRIAKFPTSGGNSPDGYVGNLLTKTLSDLGIEKPAVKKQRKRQPKKAK